MSERRRWWCVRGLQVALVESTTEARARREAARMFISDAGREALHAEVRRVAADVTARPATDIDVERWQTIERQQRAAG